MLNIFIFKTVCLNYFLKTFEIYYIDLKMMNKSQPVGVGKQQQQKQQKRCFFGFKRQNLYDYIKSSSAKLINFRISPIGIGKISTLRTKLEHIIGSIFDDHFPQEVNPCFDYIVQKLIYMELINSQKKTQYKILVSSEMVGELRNQFQEKIIKEKVSKIINEWQQEQNSQRYNFKKHQERIYRLKKYHDKLHSLRQQLKISLTEYFKAKRQKITTKLSKTQQYFFKNEYIEEVIRSIDNIETLRITHQFNKYNIFDKKNKAYFQTQQLPSQKKQSPPYFHIKINRPSTQMQPLLQTVTELVGMREKNTSYKPQSINLIKDIFQQIKKYQNISSQQKIYYEYLHPSNIIFDQISLAPKLSFLPLLSNLFGLTNKPMSLQDRILFAPTPKSFNYFKSFPEVDRQLKSYQSNPKQADPVYLKTQYMLNDPFYGNEEMFESDRHRMSQQQFNTIIQQKKQLDNLKETMVSWRFLLTSYYLLQSQEFGFVPNLNSNKVKQEMFYQKMKEANQQLLKDSSYLSNFLGIASRFAQEKPFTFTQTQIAEFLQIQIQDSVVQSNKYVIVKKYFQTRNEIIKEFIRLLVNQTIFGRIFNIKKYIFIYFTIAIEILEESKRFIKAEKYQPRQRKKLRFFLEKQLKRMKNDKNYYAYLQTTFQKIEGYRKRDPNTDHQAKFAQAQDLGKKSMLFVDETKSALKEVERLNDQLNRMENIQKFTEEDKVVFKTTMTYLDELIGKTLPKLKAQINEFIYTQLRLKHRDGPHRCPQDATKQLKESYQMYTTRLQLLTLTYISLSEQNFITYDTMVLPQFRIDQAEKRINLTKVSTNLDQQLNSLKIIGDIIEQGKLLPKQMVYFTSNKQSYEYILKPKTLCDPSEQQTRK